MDTLPGVIQGRRARDWGRLGREGGVGTSREMTEGFWVMIMVVYTMLEDSDETDRQVKVFSTVHMKHWRDSPSRGATLDGVFARACCWSCQ